METRSVVMADTELVFRMDKRFTPEDPFHESIHYAFKLNGTVFDLVYKPEPWATFDETFKAIVSNMLNIMLSRTAWPMYQDSQRRPYDKFSRGTSQS